MLVMRRAYVTQPCLNTNPTLTSIGCHDSEHLEKASLDVSCYKVLSAWLRSRPDLKDEASHVGLVASVAK